MTDIRNDNDNNDKDIFNIDRNNIDNDNQNEINPLSLTKEELLARDLAEGLNDEANLGFYISVCRKYPEKLLREIYGRVKQFPEKKIKKSKGALFNYLIQNHDKKNYRR
ncbi:MAG: hypothetical protein WC731_05880 [Candidatus Omnitrophota bacterium]|jgi:hypothetical protein